MVAPDLHEGHVHGLVRRRQAARAPPNQRELPAAVAMDSPRGLARPESSSHGPRDDAPPVVLGVPPHLAVQRRLEGHADRRVLLRRVEQIRTPSADKIRVVLARKAPERRRRRLHGQPVREARVRAPVRQPAQQRVDRAQTDDVARRQSCDRLQVRGRRALAHLPRRRLQRRGRRRAGLEELLDVDEVRGPEDAVHGVRPLFFAGALVDCGAPGGGCRRPGGTLAALGAARAALGADNAGLDYRKPGLIQPRSGSGLKRARLWRRRGYVRRGPARAPEAEELVCAGFAPPRAAF